MTINKDSNDIYKMLQQNYGHRTLGFVWIMQFRNRSEAV